MERGQQKAVGDKRIPFKNQDVLLYFQLHSSQIVSIYSNISMEGGPSLVQVIARGWLGNKLFPELLATEIIDTIGCHQVIRSQWVEIIHGIIWCNEKIVSNGSSVTCHLRFIWYIFKHPMVVKSLQWVFSDNQFHPKCIHFHLKYCLLYSFQFKSYGE